MTIAFGTAGTAVAGTTSLVLPYPASIASGDLLVLCICNKYPTNGPTQPTGWDAPSNFQQSGGIGTAGVDSGNAYCTVYLKIADGTESGDLTVTITSGNTAVGRIFRYTKDASKDWSYALANGTDTATPAAWSVTMGSDPGITANDVVIIASAENGNTAGGGHTAHAITATGVTFGTATERLDGTTAQGDDSALVVSDHLVSSGTSSAAAVYTMTPDAFISTCPAGASVLVRLREVDPPEEDVLAGGAAAERARRFGFRPL